MKLGSSRHLIMAGFFVFNLFSSLINTMTTFKPIQGTYDPNYDPRPKTVSIGVSLITVETDSFIQDDRHVEIPVDDDIVYLTVPREIVHLPCGGASYDIISDLLEQEGYLRKHWRISHVWECIPEGQHPF